MQNRNSINNHKRIFEVGVVDSVNITAIFVLFLKETFKQFLEDTGRLFMFPLAAAGSCIQSVLAWRQAKIEKGKNGTVVRALVETAGALAISTAVVGGFVAASLFATVAPIIFTVTMAAKTLFHFISAVYYWGKSAATSDSEKKKTYQRAAITNSIWALSSALSTVAVVFVMVIAKPIFAIFGVVAGVIGIGYSLYKRCTLGSKQNPLKKPLLQSSVPPSQSENLNPETPSARSEARPVPAAQIQRHFSNEASVNHFNDAKGSSINSKRTERIVFPSDMEYRNTKTSSQSENPKAGTPSARSEARPIKTGQIKRHHTEVFSNHFNGAKGSVINSKKTERIVFPFNENYDARPQSI